MRDLQAQAGARPALAGPVTGKIRQVHAKSERAVLPQTIIVALHDRLQPVVQ